MIGIICYHKNISTAYPKEWMDAFRNSILNQTYKDYQIFELNYGGGTEQIFETSYFESFELPNFVHAMNYLLDKVFQSGQFECAANTNCDDVYEKTWLQTELPFIQQGFDIVSCNFHLTKDDKIVHSHYFDKLNIKEELEKNHNIIAHPSVLYSPDFWEANEYSPDLVPFEDMLLWKEALLFGYKFKIVPDFLLHHRLHDNSVGHKLKEE